MNSKKAQEKPALMGLLLGVLCIGLPEPIEHNPFNYGRLSSVSGYGRLTSVFYCSA